MQVRRETTDLICSAQHFAALANGGQPGLQLVQVAPAPQLIHVRECAAHKGRLASPPRQRWVNLHIINRW